jgi:hypothetical protein
MKGGVIIIPAVAGGMYEVPKPLHYRQMLLRVSQDLKEPQRSVSGV